ncbi:tyrosine-type recombinase/integrase [Mycobacterium sp. KBS0706]|uniref:site-specific integrase n=1 Tax=Mycobacterium sp. KBS0706 TaxID=2578109 RepID=UPI00110F9A06|nr:site-specific integrase [Mycobacterium sp. KBS0706]TSD88917.1 tyrosine-type recombinase/integrase [Mycobacterium sp. KBS0706]
MNDVARHTRLKRRGSTYWFKAKVPKDLQGRGRFVTGKGTPKTDEAFSLRTRDPDAARRAVVEASLRFDQECDQLRRELAAHAGPVALPERPLNGAPVSLSYRQCVALSGRWLREMLAVYEAHPDNEEGNALGLDLLADAVADSTTEQHVGPFLDRLLSDEGITVDKPTRRLLVGEMVKALADHLRTATRQDGGDFSPAGGLERFPEWEPPGKPATAPTGGPVVTADAVLKGWQADQRPEPQTFDQFKTTVEAFAAHIAPRHLGQATRDDVVSWKTGLQAAGRKPSTIGTYMTRVKTVLTHAVGEGLIPGNPFAGVRKPAAKAKKGTGRRPFTDAEAVTLLTAARSRPGYLRWVPWLMAFTGARVSEVSQPMVSDLREQDGVHYLVVTEDQSEGEEATPSGAAVRSLKTEASHRRLPIHPKLIAEGFLAYAEGLPKDGALFPDIGLDRYGRRGSIAANTLRHWVERMGIDDPRIAPNHSWRHRMKDLLRNSGAPPDVQDAILGHEAGRNAGDGYGLGFAVKVLHDQLCRIAVPEGL